MLFVTAAYPSLSLQIEDSFLKVVDFLSTERIDIKIIQFNNGYRM